MAPPAAGLLGLLPGLAVAAGGGVEDSVAFVQRDWQQRSDPHVEIFRNLFSLGRGKFNCTHWPSYCQEPFNCQQVTAMKALRWQKHGYALDGHSNPQALCGDPWSSNYYAKCLSERDPVGAAHIYYKETLAGKYGRREHKLEVDGSMCFLEGLCVEDRIHSNSSMEDAEAVCDTRYGRERWNVVNSMEATKDDHVFANLGTLQEFENNVDGLRNRLQSTPIALSACAKGHFHCDVVYCKEHYCNDMYYKEKFGRFLLKYKWVKQDVDASNF
mmetsp:Transcript_45781/g.132543  ORF Transcript_45781/g.132543 Transcript_45781/m.132543 type:complete len:271 (-) Transcript_45781:101-913(-)